MTKLPLFLLTAAALTAPLANAGDFYVAGTLGRASIDLDKSGMDGALVDLGVTGLRSRTEESDTHYGLAVGYLLNQYFALEAGYVDFGTASYRASFTGGALNARIEAHGWTASVLGSVPLGQSFSLYGRLGAVQAKVESDVEANGPGGSGSGHASDRGWSPLYGIGAGYMVTPEVGIRAEFTRYDKLGGNSTGEGDVDTWTLGMTYRF